MGTRPALLRVLEGTVVEPPPVWLMRQAGRYLPEYRAIREEAGSFLDLCYTPELAAEVTLQPLRRFDFDAAILFSDILVIPDALGCAVRFVEGRGPMLEPVDLGRVNGLAPHEQALDRLAPVLETVRRVRQQLDPDKALLGFCGAPWTVATYMVAGEATPDQGPARLAALREPEAFAHLTERLVAVSADYLVAQLRAGADAVQIFDSWAGVLDAESFEHWAVRPVHDLIQRVRNEAPDARILAFPRGAGARLGRYADTVGADAISLDWTMPLSIARRLVRDGTALQGNLDPMRLVAGGAALDEGIDTILAAMRGRPHIFNLGHGVMPETLPAHVERLVARIRATGRSV